MHATNNFYHETTETYLDTINLIILINIILLFIANFQGAKKGVKTSVTRVEQRPKTYLQSVPTRVVTYILICQISSVFQLGTFTYTDQYQSLRVAGLAGYLLFSWFQIYAYRTLGENYAQDIVILKNHQLVTSGPYSVIRHPHYLGQILGDIGCAIALLSYTSGLLTLIAIPLLVLRAVEEERILKNKFGSMYDEYKKKSGFLLPFIG